MFVSTISTIQHEFNDDEEKKRENVEGGRKKYKNVNCDYNNKFDELF